MKLKVYVIDFETPRWIRKLGAWVVPMCFVLGGGAVLAAPPTLHTWTASDLLKSTDLNGNFAALSTYTGGLETRISTLENEVSVPGPVNLVSARITMPSSTCVIDREDGSWLVSATYTGTGLCTLTIAPGTFKSSPNCTMTTETGQMEVAITSSSTTTLTTEQWCPGCGTPPGVAYNNNFQIICLGAR
jgi:hypothetical protein